MPFHDYIFLFAFLPVVLAGLAIARRFGSRCRTGAVLWLIVVSLVFYVWAGPAHLLVLTASIGVNYTAGNILAVRPSRMLLWGAAGLNLAVLIGFKIVTGGAGGTIPGADIAMPLAISFFTFQQIAWLADSASGNRPRDVRFMDYCLFITFFPQLIAGPIVYAREFFPQIQKPGAFRFRARYVAAGLSLVAIGLFKKCVMADSLQSLADPVFAVADAGGTIPMADAWAAVFAYSFQIYFDFSAYSDMAIGLALMVGIRLPANFYSPYKAASLIDFWRRWHMTLSRFLRDYLYIPLGGSKHGRGRTASNLLITMILAGLWHGIGWGFLIWGAAHGILLALNHFIQSRKIIIKQNIKYNFLTVILTFLTVSLLWVFFRAETISGAASIFASLAGLNGLSLPHSVDFAMLERAQAFWPGITATGIFPTLNRSTLEVAGILALAACIIFTLPNSMQYARGFAMLPRHIKQDEGRLLRTVWRPTLSHAVFIALLGLWGVLSIQDTQNDFIYFRF